VVVGVRVTVAVGWTIVMTDPSTGAPTKCIFRPEVMPPPCTSTFPSMSVVYVPDAAEPEKSYVIR
jgi:hypothetical protein